MSSVSAGFSSGHFRLSSLTFLTVWQLLEHKLVLSDTMGFLYGSTVTNWHRAGSGWLEGEVGERRDFPL